MIVARIEKKFESDAIKVMVEGEPTVDLPASALYKQIGNSVSVPVIKAIAKNIMKAISDEGEE